MRVLGTNEALARGLAAFREEYVAGPLLENALAYGVEGFDNGTGSRAAWILAV